MKTRVLTSAHGHYFIIILSSGFPSVEFYSVNIIRGPEAQGNGLESILSMRMMCHIAF